MVGSRAGHIFKSAVQLIALVRSAEMQLEMEADLAERKCGGDRAPGLAVSHTLPTSAAAVLGDRRN